MTDKSPKKGGSKPPSPQTSSVDEVCDSHVERNQVSLPVGDAGFIGRFERLLCVMSKYLVAYQELRSTVMQLVWVGVFAFLGTFALVLFANLNDDSKAQMVSKEGVAKITAGISSVVAAGALFFKVLKKFGEKK